MPMGLALKQLTGNAAGSLDGLQWLLPSTGVDAAQFDFCDLTDSSSTTMGGDPSITYSVTLRFRGVIEMKTYTGGSNDGAFFQTDGTPQDEIEGYHSNIYSLAISNPAHTYYVNRRHSPNVEIDIQTIDYEATIPIQGGATVTLAINSEDGVMLANNAATGGPVSVPGITSPAQPYNGQFVQMNVVSVS